MDFPVDATISLPDRPDDLASLLAWLRDEDELRGRVSRRVAPIAQGDMGAATDALTVMVGSGGAVTVLLGSIAVWLKTRRSDVTVRFVLGDRKIEVDTKRIKNDPDSINALIRTVTEALRDG
ncbi:MAG TPA: hypothetical protein VH352_14410 [Pseudonocardiaceae bacterium]|nr:hypothetical protein [Pseudonocardiaceae bacterium]